MEWNFTVCAKLSVSMSTGVICCVKLLGHTSVENFYLTTQCLNAYSQTSRVLIMGYWVFVVACKMMISRAFKTMHIKTE